MDWSTILTTALPVIAIVGTGLLKTHSKVKAILITLETILAASTSGKTGE